MSQIKKRLGELLVDAGVIDEFQLKSALADQKRWGARLGSTLVKLGMATEDVMAKALSSQLKLPNVNLRTTEIPPEVYKMLKGDKAKQMGIIPVMLKQEGNKRILYLAMSDPTNLAAIDEVQFATGCAIKPVIAMDSQIQSAIERYYFGRLDDSDMELQGSSIPLRLAREAATNQEKMEIQRGGGELYGQYGGDDSQSQAPVGQPLPDGANRPRPSREMLALLRLLSKKGLITKEEFIEEFKNL